MNEHSERLYDAAVIAAQGVWNDEASSLHEKLNALSLLEDQLGLMINSVIGEIKRTQDARPEAA